MPNPDYWVLELVVVSNVIGPIFWKYKEYLDSLKKLLPQTQITCRFDFLKYIHFMHLNIYLYLNI